jgi:hypothetical protein
MMGFCEKNNELQKLQTKEWRTGFFCLLSLNDYGLRVR